MAGKEGKKKPTTTKTEEALVVVVLASSLFKPLTNDAGAEI